MYTAILFVVTTLVFSVFSFVLVEKQRERELDQYRVLLKDYVMQQETECERLKRTAEKISSFDSVASFALSQGTDYYKKMSNLREDLKKYSDSTKPIAFIHKYSDDTVISNTQSNVLGLQLKELGITEEQYAKILAQFSESDLQNARFVVTDEGILYLTTKTINRDRLVIVTFNRTWESKKEYQAEVTASFLTVGNGVLDYRTDLVRDSFAISIEKADDIHPIQSGDWGYLSVASSQAYDAVYYLRFPLKGFDAVFTVLTYLPFTVAAFMAALLITWLISKKMYRPINHLVDSFKNMQNEDNEWSGGDELDYIAFQVEKIKTKNTDLSAEVQHQEEHSKQRFLCGLLEGVYREQTLNDDLKKHQIEWLDGGNYPVRMELHLLTTDNETDFYQRVVEIAKQQLEKQFHVLFIQMPQEKGCFIVNTHEFGVLEVALNRLSVVIKTALGCSAVFLVGKLSESAPSLHYSYLTIEQVSEAQNFTQPKTVYSFTDVKENRHKDVLYPLATEQKLINCFMSGNWTAVEKMVDYIFKEYGLAADAPQSRPIFISAMSNTLSRCVQKGGLTYDMMPTIGFREIHARLQICTNSSQLQQETKVLLKEILNVSASCDAPHDHKMKEQIEDYIKQNLKNDISLITMADAFRLTPNYMSAIFKEAMGVTFKEYTSATRFKACVDILKEYPDITMSELAKEVGLNNTTTLVRLFKKYAGCSPSVYVQEHTKGIHQS